MNTTCQIPGNASALAKKESMVAWGSKDRGSLTDVRHVRSASTSSFTYLTTDELSARIKYDSRTIRERLKDSVLLEGVHYIRPFGGRKILYLWERIEEDMGAATFSTFAIPMANGGVCHG